MEPLVEITVMSGKGGTGKTSIAAAFAALAPGSVFCDNDVDASNLHLILDPSVGEEHIYFGGYIATIENAICTGCGICAEACRYSAITRGQHGKYRVDPLDCEGCRLCERICPEKAITSSRSDSSRWYVGDTRMGTLVYARLGPGEENSGKFITAIRSRARQLAIEQSARFLINDGPPGIGCAAISSITGSRLVVLVTEPTITGLHDAERLAALVESFSIPMVAIINKSDLMPEMSGRIRHILSLRNIPVIARLAFDDRFIRASLMKKSIIEYAPDSPASHSLSAAWNVLKEKTA